VVKRKTIPLPGLGEGIDSGTIIAVRVAVGDQVSASQTLFDVETEKVTVEIPSPLAGTVEALHADLGDEVRIGDGLITLNCAAATAGQAVMADTATGRHATAQPPRQAAPERQQKRAETARDSHLPAPAGPAARRRARQLGIDIRQVPGSGIRGRIGKQDVTHYARQQLQQRSSAQAAPSSLPDLTLHGAIDHTPLTSLQRATARNLARAWREIPHAWMQQQINITALEQQRKRLNQSQSQGAAKFTLTPFIIQAMASALQRFPLFNASIDLANDRIIQRRYIDMGVAVDTPRGLLVPVLRGVDRLDIDTIALQLAELATRARNNRLAPADFQGAGITLSNLGGMGLSNIQPIINWPQSAIVGVAAARWQQQRDDNGAWQEQLLLPLTLAFDHRLINGAEAARFVACIKGLLEDWQRLPE